jgi:hypothetical protein
MTPEAQTLNAVASSSFLILVSIVFVDRAGSDARVMPMASLSLSPVAYRTPTPFNPASARARVKNADTLAQVVSLNRTKE